MYSVFSITALLVLPCALAQWGVPEEGVCPEITTQQDFDLQKYMGRWYDIAHTKWAFGTDANTCSETTVVDMGQVSEAKVYQGEVLLALGESVNIQTEGLMYETEDPAALWVYYGEGEADAIGEPNHNVLATDYETFACVYSCVQVDDTTREFFAFLMGRTNTLDASARATCDGIYTDLGIDVDNMMQSYHGDDCFYFPEQGTQ